MAYALESLLKIRLMREDRASAELTAARQEVKEAADALTKRKNELEEFEATKEERRDSIYNAVLGRSISREELDRVLEGVARIDEEGALKADNVNLAEGELKKKEQAAEESRVRFVSASKNRMKITEHKTIWTDEYNAEQEKKVESELEDFTGKKNIDDANDNT